MTGDVSWPHLGDGLSALLDGELSPEDEVQARQHLAHCPDCSAELAAVADVRDAVRRLPAVDPPFGFFERLLSRRGRWRQAVGAVAAGTVAAVAVLAVATPRPQPVSPPVADLVQTHAASASVAGDTVSLLAPAGAADPSEPGR